jgi:predicted deacetylase
MGTEYLLRLDDACPTLDPGKWQAVEQLLSSHGIRPIVAIVPANEDLALVRAAADPLFWQHARTWARAGWVIALHGYSHGLRPSRAGLVPVQARSEFVDLPLDEQRRRIRQGVKVMEAGGLTAEAWVAPAHGFDRTTLQALRVESEIRLISDGFARRAYRREDFVWLPQQLWKPRAMKSGLWTICIHPNELEETGLRALDEFLDAHAGSFPDPRDAAARAVPYGPTDALFAAAFRILLWTRRKVR